MSRNVFGAAARTVLAMSAKRVNSCRVGDQDKKGKTQGECRAAVPNAIELGGFGMDSFARVVK